MSLLAPNIHDLAEACSDDALHLKPAEMFGVFQEGMAHAAMPAFIGQQEVLADMAPEQFELGNEGHPFQRVLGMVKDIRAGPAGRTAGRGDDAV